VTNTSAREEELGVGKWSDVARPLAEFQSAMDSAPVRELMIEEAGLPWLHVISGLILLGLIGWWFVGAEPESEEAAPVEVARRVTEALPDIPKVTVDTVPAGAHVFLEGVDYGEAPTAVPVPTDGISHELCVELKGQRTCRSLTGEALAFEDPYRFVIDGE
jgi:hypothetical protein